MAAQIDSASPASTTRVALAAPAAGNASSQAAETRTLDPLIVLLASKGVITQEDVNKLAAASTSAEQRTRLVSLLHQKGLLTDTEVAAISGNTGVSTPKQAPVLVASASASSYLPNAPVPSAQPQPQTHTVESGPTRPAAPTVLPLLVAAVLPLRVLPIDPPMKGGIIPAFRIGPTLVTPYGFIKSTAAHDSSMPNGDDFPFPGLFLSSTSVLNTGPNADPEFHLKARASRFGANFEWPDAGRLHCAGTVTSNP